MSGIRSVAAPLFVTASLIALATSLMACQPHDNNAETARAKAEAIDKALADGLEKIKPIKDPWVAFDTLNTAERSAYDLGSTCYAVDGWQRQRTCAEIVQRLVVMGVRHRLLSEAVVAGNRQAIAFLYGRDATGEYTDLRKNMADKVLAIADESRGVASDRGLLAAAGDIASNGDLVIADIGRAVGFYARAWGAGDAQSADKATGLFMSINDIRNGYLWSLRCTGDCKRSTAHSLAFFQSKLTAEAARQIQKLAATPSVVEMEQGG